MTLDVVIRRVVVPFKVQYKMLQVVCCVCIRIGRDRMELNENINRNEIHSQKSHSLL